MFSVEENLEGNAEISADCFTPWDMFSISHSFHGVLTEYCRDAKLFYKTKNNHVKQALKK